MNILKTIKNLFIKEEIKKIDKTIENIGNILSPVFREIPPDSKAGKFLLEGARSWAYIAMSAIADEISTIELNLYRGKGTEWTEIPNNQVLDLLEKPNQLQTREEFFWLLTIFLLAEGEAPILLDEVKNPTTMVILNPSNLKIEFDKDNLIGGYKYRRTNGTEQSIERDLIIFFKLPNFKSPFRGMGKLKYIAQTLDIDNYIEEYLRMFFFNDATPGSVLETEKELSKSIYERLKNQLKTKHQGYKKSHKNMILEGGLKWKEIGNKINELQIKEFQDNIRDKILAMFKVPKSVLGITEDVNRANGENSDRVFSRRAIKPLLKIIEAQLNQNLLMKFSEGQSLWLEFENPVKEDMKLQAEIDDIYIRNGILLVNEIRERMELKPITEKPKEEKPKEEGKKHKEPFRIMKRKGIIVECAKKEQKKSENILNEIVKDMLKKKEPKTFFTNEEIENYHLEKIAHLDRIEIPYKEKLEKFFERQQKLVLGQIVGKGAKKEIKVDIDEKKEAEIMAEISIPFIEEMVRVESELAFALLGLSGQFIDPQDELTRKFILSRTLKLGKSTAETTKQDVERILRNWSEEEGSIGDLRSQLRDYFGNAQKHRVEAIARTELSRAAGYAQEAVYIQTGASAKKWITVRDERLCEFCRTMDGREIKIGTNFWEKGDSMVGENGNILKLDYESIKTPPLHVMCRCNLIPIYGESRDYEQYYKKENKDKLDNIDKLQKTKTEIELKEKDIEEREKNIIEKEKEIDEILIEVEKQNYEKL